MMKMVNEGRTDYSLCRALQSQSWLKHQPALEEQIGFIREEQDGLLPLNTKMMNPDLICQEQEVPVVY